MAEALKTRINRLAFQSQYAKNTLVDTSKRFSTDEAFEGLDAQRELTKRERAFSAQTTIAEPCEI